MITTFSLGIVVSLMIPPNAHGEKMSASALKMAALDDGGARELLHPRCLCGIDVGDDELRAGFVQLFRQIGSDAAGPLDGDRLPLEAVRAPHPVRRRLHRAKDSVSGD